MTSWVPYITELAILYEKSEGENIYSYSKMMMIFYFDKKELKFFKVEEKATIRNKDCQFVIPCKDIVDVCYF